MAVRERGGGEQDRNRDMNRDEFNSRLRADATKVVFATHSAGREAPWTELGEIPPGVSRRSLPKNRRFSERTAGVLTLFLRVSSGWTIGKSLRHAKDRGAFFFFFQRGAPPLHAGMCRSSRFART